MLFLAMSCLQGQTQLDAFLALARLRPDGIQLTPGNLPTAGFAGLVERVRIARRYHHGFAWEAYRQPVWTGAALAVGGPGWSVHPPGNADQDLVEADDDDAWLAAAAARHAVVEVMPPGRRLGSGAAIRRAMAAGVALAVDVSHLFIQRAQGVLTDDDLAAILDHDRIAEVHVSANDGRADQHRPLAEASFGLGWARARLAAGTPVILECYFHDLDDDARRRQVDRVREP